MWVFFFITSLDKFGQKSYRLKEVDLQVGVMTIMITLVAQMKDKSNSLIPFFRD